MKTIHALLIATSFSALLSACGTPVQMAGLRQPMLAQNNLPRVNQSAVRSQNMQAQYMNLVLKTGYSPDVNNSHYGFDFGNVSYTDQQSTPMDLILRYSPQAKVLWVTLIEKDNLGQQPGQPIPEDKIEHIGQENLARLREVASQLRRLYTSNAQDKANINRIASLMEKPPVRP